MKIISGTLKGRTVKGYDIEGTRPTMDRVKESLFAMIQNHLEGSTVLDLFAGTGNLGLEAISNGAKVCYFCDCNHKCTRLIEENAKAFQVEEKVKIIPGDYRKALKLLSTSEVKLDLVFLDPPYKMECLEEVLQYLEEHSMLQEDALVICEVDHLYMDGTNYLKLKERKYGDKYIVIYQKKKNM